MVRCVLLMLIVASACADQRPPPPRDAAAACLAAIRAAGTEPVADELREALTCERLYRDRRCADAWRDLARPDSPAEWIEAVDHLIPVCRAACVRQSGGAPPRGCIDPGKDARDVEIIYELDRAMHVLSGLPAEDAEILARRASLLALGVQQGIVIPIRPPDPDPSPGMVRIQIDSDGEIRVDGDVVARDKLTEELTLRAARHQFESAMLSVPPDTQYEKVIELMDAVRAAGIEDIVFNAQ